jgi:hypothetical protein
VRVLGLVRTSNEEIPSIWRALTHKMKNWLFCEGARGHTQKEEEKLELGSRCPRLSRKNGARAPPKKNGIVLGVTCVRRRITIDSIGIGVAVTPFAVGQKRWVDMQRSRRYPSARVPSGPRATGHTNPLNRALYGRKNGPCGTKKIGYGQKNV